MKKKDLANEIIPKLKQVQQSFRYSNNMMSQKMGITPGNYRKITQEAMLPETFTLYKLSRSLNISLDWLLLGKGAMYLKKTEPETEAMPIPKIEEPLSSELKELVDLMVRIPLLRYDMLNHFHKVKEANRKMIEREISIDK
jgi:transcriptional regulator with XRE-family HTH domain